MRRRIVAVDFDGTIVSHQYPLIGRENPGAIRILKAMQEKGVSLVMWTMRSGTELQQAVDYCASNGVTFWGVNSNPEQAGWTKSPKAYAQLYIDDAALGCPVEPCAASGRPRVDWEGVEVHLKELGYL